MSPPASRGSPQYDSMDETDTVWSLTELTKGSFHEQHTTSLSELFNYFQDSGSNTLGLLRRVVSVFTPPLPSIPNLGARPPCSPPFVSRQAGLEKGHYDGQNKGVPRDISDQVSGHLARMPPRPVLNFLVQFFLAEVNWITHLIHPPSFMTQYDSWWTNQQEPATTASSPLSVADIDFAVLILRICAYATQFLPSASYALDAVRGMPLATIREIAAEVGNSLERIATSRNPRGSLVRVQHMCYNALGATCESRMGEAWATLCSTIRVAQGLGYHQEAGGAASKSILAGDEVEREMQRRVFCNLYIVDGHLARQYDRMPILVDPLHVDHLPRMHLTPEVDPASGAPDNFTERLLQARMVTFWRAVVAKKPGGQGQGGGGANKVEYDPTLAQERHEKFHDEFISKLPPAFALLEPNREWDELLPQLPLQRQLLHAAILESVCHNFRPLLLLERDRFLALPGYKRVLLLSQAQALAAAAIKVLDAVSTLHTMIGTTYTRFPTIIFHTFEASVLLACLHIKGFLLESPVQDSTAPLQEFPQNSKSGGLMDQDKHIITRDRCLSKAQAALASLQQLANVSFMAEVSARSLSQLLLRAAAAADAAAPGSTAAANTMTTPVPTPFGGEHDEQLCMSGIMWTEQMALSQDFSQIMTPGWSSYGPGHLDLMGGLLDRGGAEMEWNFL
ncbi:transcription factor sol4 [Apiospora aurea]|uniref:Transcription factor sol4 n=1 Tax=Apiospora aurea TaxID=335848 RepID=A0ABR1PXC7_9PEZI